MAALLGGALLNLMPCVFPVLSLKALSLITLREKGRGVAVWNGVAYTAGILVAFGGIGGVLTGLKAAGGGGPGWGYQLQHPAVVLGLADLLFVLGLNLSGVFSVGGRWAGAGSKWAGAGGLSGAFFTGVLAALVATPCTAPFMAGALGYALVAPPGYALGVFLALGAGLALPYLVLAVVPGLGAFLPRPGAWMEIFRKFLAFPLYASAVWLLWVLAQQVGANGLLRAMGGMVGLGFALWLLGLWQAHQPENAGRRGALLLLALLVAGGALQPLYQPALLPPIATAKTQPYSAARLKTLLDEKRPVFVYMTAAWCITCKVNERVALETDAVRALFRKNNIAVLEGDWTSMDPAITQYLASMGRNGVPLYVYYPPVDSQGVRAAPIILPQILTPGIVKGVIEGAEPK